MAEPHAAGVLHRVLDIAAWLADDASILWDWVYLPEQPTSEEYHWVWRFTCEMPEAARDPEAWVRGIEPLYRPGDGTAEGTKRSCEMIYRSWQALEKWAKEGKPAARDVQSAFLSEFEGQILSGNRGPDIRRIADEFCAGFIEVPAGTFRMGSPPEKQGMPEDVRTVWEDYMDSGDDPNELAEKYLDKWYFPPGKRGEEEREEEIEWWTRVFRDHDLEAIVERMYPSDETSAERVQQVSAFRLHSAPVLNCWYRLFRTGSRVEAVALSREYAQRSPQTDTPAIFVSWYDAWVFCQWARWDGHSCRLPHEDEWEYAAKADTAWDRNYWWGDEFDPAKCNADENVGHDDGARCKP